MWITLFECSATVNVMANFYLNVLLKPKSLRILFAF